MSGYSMDLRERIIQAWENGKTQRWIAETYAVNISTVKRYISRYRQTGSVAPSVQGRQKPIIGEADRSAIERMVAQTPMATLAQYCEQWASQSGMPVSIQTMSRVLQRFGLGRKKDGWGIRTR